MLEIPRSRHWQVGLRSGSDPLGESPLSLRGFSGPLLAGGRWSLVPDFVTAPGGSAIWWESRGVCVFRKCHPSCPQKETGPLTHLGEVMGGRAKLPWEERPGNPKHKCESHALGERPAHELPQYPALYLLLLGGPPGPTEPLPRWGRLLTSWGESGGRGPRPLMEPRCR